VKTQAAAEKQMEDIRMIEEDQKYDSLNQKLKDVVDLRKEHPDSSLNELADILEQKTGSAVSKSGMKHRFIKIHEIAVRGHHNVEE
jgi:DNA-binding protein WhiA